MCREDVRIPRQRKEYYLLRDVVEDLTCPTFLYRYFYESSTGVYYDPKSKLYCKDSRWHRHVPGQDPPYLPVEQQSSQQQQSQDSKASTPGTVVLPLPNAGDALASTVSTPADNTTTTGSSTSSGPGGDGTVTAATGSGGKGGAGIKRSASGTTGGKKQRIAFGFKGIKLSKSGSTGASDLGLGNEDNGETAGGDASGTAAGSIGVGSLAKKRLLHDVSKWNARKQEVRVP